MIDCLFLQAAMVSILTAFAFSMDTTPPNPHQLVSTPTSLSFRVGHIRELCKKAESMDPDQYITTDKVVLHASSRTRWTKTPQNTPSKTGPVVQSKAPSKLEEIDDFIPPSPISKASAADSCGTQPDKSTHEYIGSKDTIKWPTSVPPLNLSALHQNPAVQTNLVQYYPIQNSSQQIYSVSAPHTLWHPSQTGHAPFYPTQHLQYLSVPTLYRLV